MRECDFLVPEKSVSAMLQQSLLQHEGENVIPSALCFSGAYSDRNSKVSHTGTNSRDDGSDDYRKTTANKCMIDILLMPKYMPTEVTEQLLIISVIIHISSTFTHRQECQRLHKLV